MKQTCSASHMRMNAMNYIRLNPNATNLHDATVYYQDRARQLISADFLWTKIVTPVIVDGLEVGIRTTFQDAIDLKREPLISVYVYDQYRGNGMFSKAIESDKHRTFVTVDNCNLEDWFVKHGISCVIANPPCIFDESAYACISHEYGTKRAERSKIPYMNHIDEGIYILKARKADRETISAYMLHPLYQNDQNTCSLALSDKFRILVKREPLKLGYLSFL